MKLPIVFTSMGATALFLTSCVTAPQAPIISPTPVQIIAPLAYPNSSQAVQPKVAPVSVNAPTIELTSPQHNYRFSSPDQRQLTVSGIVRQGDPLTMQPVVIVHPLKWNPGDLGSGEEQGVIWVQPIPQWTGPRDGGFGFSCTAYFGNKITGQGESFEVFAMMAPKGQYRDGQRLPQLPSSVREISNGVTVHRPE